MAWVSPRVWIAEALTAAKMNEISSSLNAAGDKPPTYVPTASAYTSNISVAGTNQEIGKWTNFTITATFSGLPAGAGVTSFTLPSTPSADYSNWSTLGTCSVRDVSASASTVGVAVYAGGANVTAYFTSTRLQNAFPYTFASGDIIHIQGRYYRD